MSFDQWVFVGYAIFLLVGAFFGFKAGSKVSLFAGTFSGLLVLFGVMLLGKDPRNGFLFLSILNGLLCVSFLMRLLKTKKFMPSGMLLTVSAGALVFSLLRFFSA
jgi:uncharacterized membrane protein (UPF0136 family)